VSVVLVESGAQWRWLLGIVEFVVTMIDEDAGLES